MIRINRESNNKYFVYISPHVISFWRKHFLLIFRNLPETRWLALSDPKEVLRSKNANKYFQNSNKSFFSIASGLSQLQMTPIAGGKCIPSSKGTWFTMVTGDLLCLWEHSHSIPTTCHPFLSSIPDKLRSFLMTLPLSIPPPSRSSCEASLRNGRCYSCTVAPLPGIDAVAQISSPLDRSGDRIIGDG